MPKTLVIDNLKAAVLHADWFDPELNPKLQSFAEHYGTVILPTRPRTPRHKGKVERGVGYVQDNGLKARASTRWRPRTDIWLDWEATVADTRIHGTTKRQVGKVFREVERRGAVAAAGRAIPLLPRGAADRQPRRPHRSRQGVLLGAAGVPGPHRCGSRWDAQLVRVFNHRLEQIALHRAARAGQVQHAGRTSGRREDQRHRAGRRWLLAKAASIGEQRQAWARRC